MSGTISCSAPVVSITCSEASTGAAGRGSGCTSRGCASVDCRGRTPAAPLLSSALLIPASHPTPCPTPHHHRGGHRHASAASQERGGACRRIWVGSGCTGARGTCGACVRRSSSRCKADAHPSPRLVPHSASCSCAPPQGSSQCPYFLTYNRVGCEGDGQLGPRLQHQPGHAAPRQPAARGPDSQGRHKHACGAGPGPRRGWEGRRALPGLPAPSWSLRCCNVSPATCSRVESSIKLGPGSQQAQLR